MIAGNATAAEWKDRLVAEAHVRTHGVRVVILHPRYTGTEACPTYRNGTIRLPSFLFTDEDDPDFWKKTWKHELQHAADDRSGIMGYLTREENERRARRAETAEPRYYYGDDR